MIAFLWTFRTPTYSPRARVSYSVTGTYEIDTTDAYYAEPDAATT